MIDTLGSVLLMALLAGAVMFTVHFMRLGNRPRSVLLASLAGRWNGRVHRGGFFGGDRIEIRVEGVPGEVTFGEVGRNYSDQNAGWTRVRFDWPSERRLRVAPEGFASRIRRLFGGSDIEFDDPPFDDRFWVESSHPTWGRSLLDPAARRAFLSFRRSPSWHGPDDVTLDVGPAGIMLRAAHLLVDDAAALGSFIELAISVLQKAKGLVEAAGVVLEPVRTQTGSACPVCGHAVADAPLPCPACRTPHHRECWKYFGGCAIFGCRTRMK